MKILVLERMMNIWLLRTFVAKIFLKTTTCPIAVYEILCKQCPFLSHRRDKGIKQAGF